jgi:voltage-gated potassium channel
MFVRETCAAAVLIILTLWLQCGGVAMLITWFRGSVAGDTDKFGLFRTAVLIVRFTTAVVVLHLIEAVVWAIFYRWFCLLSWEAAFYFSAGSYGTVGCSDVSLPPNWRALGPLESITGALMCGISVSLLFATYSGSSIKTILERRPDASALLIKAIGGGWDTTKIPQLRS